MAGEGGVLRSGRTSLRSNPVHQYFVVESETEIASIIVALTATYVYRITHVPQDRADTSFLEFSAELVLTLLVEMAVDATNACWMYYYEGFRVKERHLDTRQRITLTLFMLLGVTNIVRWSGASSVWSSKANVPVAYEGNVYWVWAYDD